MRPGTIALLAAASLVALACRTTSLPREGGFATDGAGRPIRQLESGSTLFVGARALRPNTLYELRMSLGPEPAPSLDRAVSFARSTTNARGDIPPFALWYQSGVVGCAARKVPGYRTFDEAERALAGRSLTVTIHEVLESQPVGGRITDAKTSAAISRFAVPVTARRSRMIYPSNAEGCLVNSVLTGEEDLYVSGRNFAPGQQVEIAVVPNQRQWRVNDRIDDVSGASSSPAMERVTADRDGRFTIKAWERATHRRGVYDLVARDRGQLGNLLSERDIVSFGSESGVVLYSLYPVGGPTMDIAGRPTSRTPYYEFSDSFADSGDPVWGAVDPTYVPVDHPGGTYASYYVVPHRTVLGWENATALVDQSGGPELHPVKAGCVNGTDVIIWNPPLAEGEYDVVVDFGDPVTFTTDGHYNAEVDFLDGATQVGFIVAKDPYELGTTPIGVDAYSFDDFFPQLVDRFNVDLRATVHYPATVAGAGTPVAPGAHPIFVIEHGNHESCNSMTSEEECEFGYLADHTGCVDKEINHLGYNGLLDRLASHGIIAVSIDAYDLTGPCMALLHDDRSELLLKHLEFWSHLHDASTFTSYPDPFSGRFAGHVDLSKISLSGHSRGGEASVGAYMRNLAAGSPFTIGSVSSVAPTDYNNRTLPDVPYFVIIPAGDEDLSDLPGLRIYDRAGSTLAAFDATTKSGIDVYGANHSFFNTVWAADGDEADPARPDYIPPADQQRLGEAYLAAFARVYLKGETVYEDLFRGKLVFPSFAGRKIYAFRHEKSHSKLDDGTWGGTPTDVTTVSVIPPVHSTAAIRVNWPSASSVITYNVPAPQRDTTGFEVLSFRAGQTISTINPAVGSQDFQIELVGGGQVKATYIGNFGVIPKPYPRITGATWSVMTTVRVPLHSFILNNAGVTLDDIDTVRFRFTSPGTGEIYVDDIEFSR